MVGHLQVQHIKDDNRMIKAYLRALCVNTSIQSRCFKAALGSMKLLHPDQHTLYSTDWTTNTEPPQTQENTHRLFTPATLTTDRSVCDTTRCEGDSCPWKTVQRHISSSHWLLFLLLLLLSVILLSGFQVDYTKTVYNAALLWSKYEWILYLKWFFFSSFITHFN